MTSGQYSFCLLLNADWLIQISEELAACKEKVASSKNATQFQMKVHIPYPISDQNGQNLYPITDQNGYMAYIREYPPGGYYPVNEIP